MSERDQRWDGGFPGWEGLRSEEVLQGALEVDGAGSGEAEKTVPCCEDSRVEGQPLT